MGLDTFRDDDTGIAFQDVRVAPLFPSSAALESLHEERNRVRGRETFSMLEAWHATALGLDANESIAALTASASGTQHYQWRGPVVVLAMTRSTGWIMASRTS